MPKIGVASKKSKPAIKEKGEPPRLPLRDLVVELDRLRLKCRELDQALRDLAEICYTRGFTETGPIQESELDCPF